MTVKETYNFIRKGSPIVSKSDIAFALILLVFAFLAAIFLWSRPHGATVIFRQNGEVIGSYALDQDRIIEIGGTYTNVFEVRDGQVHILTTTCPNHQCEKMGTISASGASIICVPNHVSASITGGDSVDAYTG